nr:hypothetical protein HAGR004_05000 [Bdellovibrio sp. HAGR004]
MSQDGTRKKVKWLKVKHWRLYEIQERSKRRTGIGADRELHCAPSASVGQFKRKHLFTEPVW